jgi:hypothetical protein
MPGSVHVEFVVDKVALGQVLLPSSLVLPCQYRSVVLHTHITWGTNNKLGVGRHLTNLNPSSHLRLRLPSYLFPLGFPTKTLYSFLSSTMRATCTAHLIRLDLICLITSGDEYKMKFFIGFFPTVP